MSRKSMGKSTDEVYLDLVAEYRQSHDGPLIAEKVGLWIDQRGLLPKPTINAAKAHAKSIKQALKRSHAIDGKGRKISNWIAVKIEKLTAHGQKVFEVIWDQIHEMSVDHALSAFQQRDDLIEKQRRAATRNLQSFLDFNPNAMGNEYQFVFAFAQEEPVAIRTEEIVESDIVSIRFPDGMEKPSAPR